MTKTWKKVTAFLLGLVMLGGAVGGGAFANSVGGGVELDAAQGDELAVLQGTGSGYATRKTTTDSHGVGWVLRTGQNGYLGVNSASNHSNVSVTDVDLPVVQGAVADAAEGQGGIYYYYTTTPVANVGSLVFSYTAANNYTNAKAKVYVVSGTEQSAVGGTPYELVSLSESSERQQGYSIESNSGGTHSFVFNQTQADAKYYGLVIVLSAYQRYTAGKIQLLEGASLANLTGLEATIPEENLYTTDVLSWEDFSVVGTKSDGSEVTIDDVTASIGHDTEFRPVEWGVTQPLVTDTTVRFTSLLANTSGEYETCDVAIYVSEPVITEIVISGDMAAKEYAVGSSWDPTGLTVTGTLSPEGTINLTNEVVWSYDPATAELGTTEVKVTATYNELVANATITDVVVKNEVTDIITVADLGTDTSYTDLDLKKESGAHYIGSVANNDNNGYRSIQINSNRANRAISTDSSGGKVCSVTIDFAPHNQNTVEVLGNNTAYTASSTAGASLGTLSADGTITVEGDYTFIRIQSTDGAVYMDSIQVTWEPTSSVVTLDSVEVVGTMNKTEYYTNEQWKADGLSVDLHYSDGAVSNITSGYTLTWDPATPTLGTEQVSVTATYNNVTSEPVKFNVTVQEYVAPVYSFHPTDDPAGFSGNAGSFTGEGLGWEFYMTGTGAKAQAFDNTRGLHFGSGNNPADTVTLYSDVFAASTGETMINRIVVNASSATGNDGSVKMDVKINNTVVGSVTLTKDATDYSFVLPTPAWGVVEIVLTNGGSKAAMYIGGVDIYAKADETITTEVVAAINALTDFRTCDVTQGHEAFGTFLTTHAGVLETLRGMNEVYVHDYENDAYANEVYVDGALKTRIITVAEKLAACEARYQVGEQVNAPSVFGNNDTTLMVVIIVIALASVSSLIGFHYYDKKRRVNK